VQYEYNALKETKKYTVQFKEQALEFASKEGIPKASKDLGIPESMLYSWRAKPQQAGQPFENQKPQQVELARLKRENQRLDEENRFLKKAAAYFAHELSGGTP
jgi:transposase